MQAGIGRSKLLYATYQLYLTYHMFYRTGSVGKK